MFRVIEDSYARDQGRFRKWPGQTALKWLYLHGRSLHRLAAHFAHSKGEGSHERESNRMPSRIDGARRIDIGHGGHAQRSVARNRRFQQQRLGGNLG
jgi:hypothetical protein